MLKILFLSLGLWLSGTAFAADLELQQQRIVGGYDSLEGNWPWMVSLSWSAFSASQLFCGGSLIADQWVLTAAHCMYDQSGLLLQNDEFVVYVGGHHLYDSPGQVMAVEQVIVHPGYNDISSDNDIALLRLKESVAEITPVSLITTPLAASLEAVADDDVNDVTVIGWGDTENPVPQSFPDTLQQVELPYISNTLCNSSEYLNGAVTSNMLCAGLPAGGIDSCQGDSGGPLVYQDAGNWYQSGIVSWGYGCAEPSRFGVYTRVENYLGWIDGYLHDLTVKDLFFPPIVAGQQMHLPLSVVNSTAGTISITSVTPSSTELSIEGTPCGSLLAGQSCDFSVVYSPLVAGELAESISITTDSIDYPALQAGITGQALAVVSAVNPIIGNPDPAPVWGSGGDGSWMQDITTGTEGAASIVSNDALLNNQSSWLVAHVSLTEQKTLFFNWKVSSEKYFDGIELMLDGKVIEGISGEIKWKQNSVNIPAGDHVIHWRYRKDISWSDGDDRGWLDNLSWDAPLPMQVFGETSTTLTYQTLNGDMNVGSPGLSWSTSIAYSWMIDSTTSTEGVTSLSGAAFHGEHSAVRALVSHISNNKTLSFDLKLSTEPDADSLIFYINGVRKLELSGNRDWKSYQFDLAPGSYEFIWEYSKDASINMGDDRVWLDNVKMSDVSHGNGSTGLSGLFALFLYAYMNLLLRKKR